MGKKLRWGPGPGLAISDSFAARLKMCSVTSFVVLASAGHSKHQKAITDRTRTRNAISYSTCHVHNSTKHSIGTLDHAEAFSTHLAPFSIWVGPAAKRLKIQLGFMAKTWGNQTTVQMERCEESYLPTQLIMPGLFLSYCLTSAWWHTKRIYSYTDTDNDIIDIPTCYSFVQQRLGSLTPLRRSQSFHSTGKARP